MLRIRMMYALRYKRVITGPKCATALPFPMHCMCRRYSIPPIRGGRNCSVATIGGAHVLLAPVPVLVLARDPVYRA